jgi:hypothetical protein
MSMKPIKQLSENEREENHELDASGTDQSEALSILLEIRDEAFDGSDEKLAVALGRPKEEIAAFTRGDESVDADLLMKARALAADRGLGIEE